GDGVHQRIADRAGPARAEGGPGGEIGGDCLANGPGGVGVAEVVQQQRHRQHGGGGVGDVLPGDVGGRAVDRLEHGRVGAGGVDVTAGGQADAAADGGREIRDDVPEQIVGDDHVEAGRVGDQVDHGRVHVRVVDRDLRVLGADLVDDAVPQMAGVDQHVVLVHEGQPAAAPPGLLEGVADHALHADGRVQRDLGGDLQIRAGAHRAAVADVRPFGPLPHHQEVDGPGGG